MPALFDHRGKCFLALLLFEKALEHLFLNENLRIEPSEIENEFSETYSNEEAFRSFLSSSTQWLKTSSSKNEF